MTTQQPRASRLSVDELPGVNWIRRNKLASGIGAAAAAVIIVAVIVIVSGSGSTPRARHAAKTPPKAPATAGSRWVEGAARPELAAVNAALIALTDATAKGDAAAAAAAGTRLTHAASAAQAGAMPPVAAGLYRTALAELDRAGRAAAAGRLAAAARPLDAGIANLIKVTASANAARVP